MMSDLITRLAADEDISLEVDARIYDTRAQQGAGVPYIVLNEISSVRFPKLSGATGLVQKRVQIDVWAATPTSARTVSEHVRDCLHGYRGTMGSTVVRRCHLDGDMDGYEAPTDGSAYGKSRRIMELLITHTESVPAPV